MRDGLHRKTENRKTEIKRKQKDNKKEKYEKYDKI